MVCLWMGFFGWIGFKYREVFVVMGWLVIGLG